jgi:hypothetical protein
VADMRQPAFGRRADLWSGLLFAGIGSAALWIGADYAQGVPSRIGPGYAPRLLGLLLVGLGGFLTLRSLWGREEIDTTVAWRPASLVLASLVAFALVFDFSGLVPAVLVTVAIANYAVADNRWTTAIGLGALLALFAWALFVKALGLPLPVFVK